MTRNKATHIFIGDRISLELFAKRHLVSSFVINILNGQLLRYGLSVIICMDVGNRKAHLSGVSDSDFFKGFVSLTFWHIFCVRITG